MLKWAARMNKQPTHIFLRQNVNNKKPGVIQMFSVIKYVSNFSISAPLELVKRFFRHTVHKSLILSANARHLWIRMIHYDDISSKLKGKVMCQVVWLIHRVSLLSAIERCEVERDKILPISMHFFQRPAVVFISMKEVPSVLLLNFSVM